MDYFSLKIQKSLNFLSIWFRAIYLDVAKSGSLPANVKFGVKACTERQFLTSDGLKTNITIEFFIAQERQEFAQYQYQQKVAEMTELACVMIASIAIAFVLSSDALNPPGAPKICPVGAFMIFSAGGLTSMLWWAA